MAGQGERQQPFGTTKVDVGPIDHGPPVGPDLDGPPAGIAQVEEIGRDVAVAVLAAADANEDRRRAAIEPRPGLEQADHASNRPLGRGLATIDEIAIDQPVAESRRLEPVDLVPIANLHPGMEPAVGRAIEPRTRGEAQQSIDRTFALIGILDDLVVVWSEQHGAYSLLAQWLVTRMLCRTVDVSGMDTERNGCAGPSRYQQEAAQQSATLSFHSK